MRTNKRLSVVVASSIIALTGVLVGGSGNAFAYGSADQPVAQVEISANCNNAGFFFCTDVVGLGGVWTWAELDNVPSADVPGWNEMDATFAGCGHTVGGGGPGSAGGHGQPVDTGVWHSYASLGEALAANPQAIPIFALFGSDYTGSVYVLDYFPGTDDDFIVAVPTQQGHYSQHPVAGVTVQIQIAP